MVLLFLYKNGTHPHQARVCLGGFSRWTVKAALERGREAGDREEDGVSGMFRRQPRADATCLFNDSWEPCSSPPSGPTPRLLSSPPSLL